MKLSESPAVQKFQSYPSDIQHKLLSIHQLIIEVAENKQLGKPEQSLKWGEPSYLVKGGSPIRLDRRSKTPEQYALFFSCNSKLVDTFREIYGDVLSFEGNRAIVFHKTDRVPKRALAHCIELAMTYHKVKSLPLLGASIQS